MKRKLALVLAGVMTMSMLPMNLFAASTSSSTNWLSVQESGTVLYENTLGLNAPFGDSGDAEAATASTNLKIQANDGIDVGEVITIDLSNAEWFFRSYNEAQTDPNYPSANTSATALTAIAGMTDTFRYFKGGVAPVLANLSGQDRDGTEGTKGTWNFFTNATTTPTTTFDTRNGAWFTGAGVNPAYEGVYINTTPGKKFILGVSSVYSGKAYVTFLDPIAAGTLPINSVEIPIVARVIDEGKDAIATIHPVQSTHIQGVTVPIVSVGSGGTKTSTTGSVVGRNSIELDPIVITENKIGVMHYKGNSATTPQKFKLVAPDGWKFANPNPTTDPVEVSFYGGFNAKATAVVAFGDGDNGSVATDPAELWFTVSNFTPSQNGTTGAGSIYIKNVRLVRDGGDYNTELSLKIRDLITDDNYENGLNITEESFKVADAKDYAVTLTQTTAADKVPQLVTGRYPSSTTSALGTDNQVVKFTLAESTLTSWWTERDTSLVFPEGVKVIGVKAASTNFNKDGTKEIYDIDTKKFDSAINNTLAYEVDGNKLTILGAPQPDDAKKSKIEFTVWVSVGQSFNQTAEPKDITVSVEGGGLKAEELPPALKVATAVAPVTITTEVNEIKIGLQAQPTSNIIIKENFAGALKDQIKSKAANRDVNLMVSDVYGKLDDNDLLFTNTAKIAVTEGDIKIDEFIVGGSLGDFDELMGPASNKIAFDVDKESKKPSTITISEVSIKASRVIPETDKDTYKVFAYGPAIAYNFNSKNTNDGRFGTLADAGVYADYVKIGSAGDAASASSEFKFSISEGTTTYNVNGKEYPLPEDMKGYNKNGTVMVPIRLISEGFGLGVHWNDSTKTVVVDLSQVSKAEFPVGKTYMKVAGAQIDMVDANGKAVATENIKGRTFLPIRQLAYALGINDANIVWDNDTQTVTFNPSK